MIAAMTLFGSRYRGVGLPVDRTARADAGMPLASELYYTA